LTLKNARRAANVIGGAYKTYKEFKRSFGGSQSKVDARRAESRRELERLPTQHAKVQNEGAGGQCTYVNIPRLRSSFNGKTQKALAPITIVTNNAAQVKSSVGLQNAADVFSMALKADLTLETAGNTSTRILLESYRGEAILENVQLSNVRITLYDCIAKRDLPVAIESTPVTAWTSGYTAMAAGSVTNPGATPWESDQFNDFYKVINKSEIILGAGACHRHIVTGRPNQLLTGAVGQTFNGYRDCTYFLLMVVSGSPSNDTVTQTQVSLGVATVNVVWQTDHKWKQLSDATEGHAKTNNLITAFTTAEQVVNIGGTTITPNAEG